MRARSGNSYTLELGNEGGCHGCLLAGVCNHQNKTVEVQSELDLSLGQKVALEVKPSDRILSSFVIFVVPIVLMIIFYFLGGLFLDFESGQIIFRWRPLQNFVAVRLSQIFRPRSVLRSTPHQLGQNRTFKQPNGHHTNDFGNSEYELRSQLLGKRPAQKIVGRRLRLHRSQLQIRLSARRLLPHGRFRQRKKRALSPLDKSKSCRRKNLAKQFAQESLRHRAKRLHALQTAPNYALK